MPDRAIRWLSIAVDRGFINYPFLARHDPLLQPLRTDSRFRQLLATVGERWEKLEPQRARMASRLRPALSKSRAGAVKAGVAES